MHTLIIMMGPSGLGKTTLARQLAEKIDDCVHVSRDEIRYRYLQPEDDYFQYESRVEFEFYDSINNMLLTHNCVIADATHITKSSRNKLFNYLDLENIRIVGLWLEGYIKQCIDQNAQRTGRSRVPDEVIKNQFKYKIPPSADEGFDDLIFYSTEQGLTSSTHEGEVMDISERIEQLCTRIMNTN